MITVSGIYLVLTRFAGAKRAKEVSIWLKAIPVSSISYFSALFVPKNHSPCSSGDWHIRWERPTRTSSHCGGEDGRLLKWAELLKLYSTDRQSRCAVDYGGRPLFYDYWPTAPLPLSDRPANLSVWLQVRTVVTHKPEIEKILTKEAPLLLNFDT